MILNDCKSFGHSSHQEAKFIIQPFHDKIVTTSTNKGELLAFEFSSLGPCSFPLVFEHLLCRNLLLETSHLERSSVSHQSQLRPDLVPVIEVWWLQYIWVTPRHLTTSRLGSWISWSSCEDIPIQSFPVLLWISDLHNKINTTFFMHKVSLRWFVTQQYIIRLLIVFSE